ncbi:TetR/AcrR family transcriptional regulator [Salisaeta longa]|uniref:TetR/AcrR family transcriptional regulator n=1 Tax=Salisaeta longa TaxID=503170 RepID=UPI0003B36C4B|nr:TetR/AcrR family transcriptional regulator [Salisaeta longa]
MASGSSQPLDDYSDTERAIFDAALHEFARKGRDGARMQAIADAADINKSMLHYYFRSKEQLYEQVFAYTMQRFMQSFGASLHEAATFKETLRAFIDGYVSFIQDNRAVVKLMVGENLSGGTLLAEHMGQFRSMEGAPPRIITNRIETAIAEGTVRPVAPEHATLTIVSSCLFFFVMEPTVRVFAPAAHDDWPAFVEARKTHIFDLIYHGLAPRDAS